VKIPQLTVGAAALSKALRSLKAAKPSVGQAIFREEDGRLVIELGGTAVTVPATGEWLGRVHLNGKWLLSAVSSIPKTGKLALSHSDGRLRIGTITVTATWQDIAPATTIVMPVNPSLTDFLCLPLAFSAAEIESCGLTALVADAQVQRRRLEDRAAHVLEDFGVRPSEVSELMETGLRRLIPPAWRRPA